MVALEVLPVAVGLWDPELWSLPIGRWHLVVPWVPVGVPLPSLYQPQCANGMAA